MTPARQKEILRAYVEAFNELDDYFEYKAESKKDRVVVFGVLDRLNDKIQPKEEPPYAFMAEQKKGL